MNTEIQADDTIPSLYFDNLPPLSLYIHFPWCKRKCPYCDFYSHERVAPIPEKEYIAALCQDFESALPLVSGRDIHSIFIGGGTPSLVSGEGVGQLLAFIKKKLPVSPECEISMEANPGTLEAGKFKAYRDGGINRLSIGIQSFSNQYLLALGRIHNASEAKKAVETAREYFDNINLDLMYALPFQTVEHLRQDLQTALAYAPEHLSLYQLTIELHTYFAKNVPDLPESDTVAEMQDLIESMTTDAGYQHYEVSAYAQPGKACQHNLNYWSFGDYLGIGAGAHSKITAKTEIRRQARVLQPDAYMEKAGKGSAIEEDILCTPLDIGFEFMLNALRLYDGFTPEFFTQRTACPLEIIQKNLDEAQKKGLLYRDQEWIKPTNRGRQFLSDLQQIFLPD